MSDNNLDDARKGYIKFNMTGKFEEGNPVEVEKVYTEEYLKFYLKARMFFSIGVIVFSIVFLASLGYTFFSSAGIAYIFFGAALLMVLSVWAWFVASAISGVFFIISLVYVLKARKIRREPYIVKFYVLDIIFTVCSAVCAILIVASTIVGWVS